MRILTVLCMLLVLLPAVAFAQAEFSPVGEWVEGEKGAHVFRRISISDKAIRYRSGESKSWCRVSYKVVERSSGNSYPDQQEHFKVMAASSGRRYSIVTFELKHSRCIGARFVQLANPFGMPDYMDVVEYNAHRKVMAWTHYLRADSRAKGSGPKVPGSN